MTSSASSTSCSASARDAAWTARTTSFPSSWSDLQLRELLVKSDPRAARPPSPMLTRSAAGREPAPRSPRHRSPVPTPPLHLKAIPKTTPPPLTASGGSRATSAAGRSSGHRAPPLRSSAPPARGDRAGRTHPLNRAVDRELAVQPVAEERNADDEEAGADPAYAHDRCRTVSGRCRRPRPRPRSPPARCATTRGRSARWRASSAERRRRSRRGEWGPAGQPECYVPARLGREASVYSRNSPVTR